MDKDARIRQLEAELDAERMQQNQEVLPGFDKGGRVTPVGMLFAKFRVEYPAGGKFSNGWCYARAVGAIDDKPTPAHRQKAYELMRNPAIKAHIANARAKVEKRIEVDRDALLVDLLTLKDEELGKLPIPETHISEEGDVKLVWVHRRNPSTALRTIELLGKVDGIWKEKTEVSGPDGQPLAGPREVHYVNANNLKTVQDSVSGEED